MYKELLMQIGGFKNTEEMIKKFIEKDCHGDCTICFYGLNTIRINSTAEITLCNLMQTFYHMLLKEIIEMDIPVSKFVNDYMNCGKFETCEKCSCSSEKNRFICNLLSHYRDELIEKIYEIS